jgi:hypothetical protein
MKTYAGLFAKSDGGKDASVDGAKIVHIFD